MNFRPGWLFSYIFSTVKVISFQQFGFTVHYILPTSLYNSKSMGRKTESVFGSFHVLLTYIWGYVKKRLSLMTLRHCRSGFSEECK